MSEVHAPPEFVLYADRWCPHTCAADAGDPGYLVELARSALAGHRVTYRNASWSRLSQVVMEPHRPYAVLGVGRGADTEAFFHLVGPPPVRTPFCFFTRAGDAWTYRQPLDLQGRVLGLTHGYHYGEAIDAWLRSQPAPRINVVKGDNPVPSHVGMLALGRSDVVLEDRVAVRWHMPRASVALREAGCLKEGDPGVYIGVPKASRDAKRWATLMQEGLNRLRASGETDRILDRYAVPVDAR